MALSRHIPITNELDFPAWVYAVGGVEQVIDFDASTPGQRVQAHDRDSGLPLWAISVFDPDPEVRAKVIRVKIASRTPPVLPQPPAGSPFPAVAFEGLTATPYVDTSGSRPRLAWSFRATAVRAASPKAQVPQPLSARSHQARGDRGDAPRSVCRPVFYLQRSVQRVGRLPPKVWSHVRVDVRRDGDRGMA